MRAPEPFGAAAKSAAAPPVASEIGCIVAPRLYAIADGDALELEKRGSEAVIRAVETMAEAGIRWIQLRLKRASDRARLEVAEACQRRLEGSLATLWIDDRVDIAALVGTGGVHLGQQDLSPAAARRVLGAGPLVGLSCHDLAQVAAAEQDPHVDVVAVGPVFPTRSKQAPDPVIGVAGVAAARSLTQKPLVAIGGIEARNALSVLEQGADSVVMLGALCRGDVAGNCHRIAIALSEIDGAPIGETWTARLEKER